jgi:hypothetical protein
MVGNNPKIDIPDPVCPFCGDPWNTHSKKNVAVECPNEQKCDKQRWCGGTHRGNPTTLASAISMKMEVKKESHPLNYKPRALAAHHLICSESMEDDNDWEVICELSGYNINCYKNGVYLPYYLEQACYLNIPLHRGNHDRGYGWTENYPLEVKKEIRSVLKKYSKPNVCEKPEKLKQLALELNASSEKILKFISKFIWTITWDGFDYKQGNPIGCANVRNIPDKREKLQELLKDKKDNQADSITATAVNVTGGKFIKAFREKRAKQEKLLAESTQNSEYECSRRIHKETEPKDGKKYKLEIY